jgi:hypothetical protein
VATPVQVDTGGAVVYGMPYENTAAVNVAVVSPTTDTRQDLIVLRRDWAAQTIRITKIDGVEGGGVPAHTQSAAPSGTGIYDIPLASLSTTIGGVIAVTDLREFCLFGTGVADDAFATAQINNDAVDFVDRETRETVLFVGASDLEVIPQTKCFTYAAGSAQQMTLADPTWDGAANASGWRMTGTGGYKGVQGSIWLPPANWAGSDVETYLWWTSNFAGTSTCYFRSAALLYSSLYEATYYPTGSVSSYLSGTVVVSDIYRNAGFVIESDEFGPSTDRNHCTFAIWWYNSAGVEDVDLLGVEFRYTGYA